MMLRLVLIFRVIGVFFLVTASTAVWAHAASYRGPYWNGDALANAVIGGSSNKQWSFRFKAEYTDYLTAIRLYVKFDDSRTGYHSGDGGDIKIDLQRDDGSSSHIPSGTTLSSATIKDPLAPPVPGDPISTAIFREVKFPSPAKLEAGRIYHIVFTNVDRSPTVNWVSVNCLFNSEYTSNTPLSPVISNTDWAALFRYVGSSSWKLEMDQIPILQLTYGNGKSHGNGYTGGAHVYHSIGGSTKIRQSMTFSGENVTASSIGIRLKRVSSSGNLIVALQQSDGTTLEQGTIPSSSVGTGRTWVEFKFSKPRTFISGKTYYITLSAPSGSYSVGSLSDGGNYGFKSKAVFAEGRVEGVSASRDIPFYLTLDSGSSTVIAAPKNLRLQP